jgi:hypothetical protein
MTEQVASTLVLTLGIYLALGVLFALPFAFWGSGRLDPDARAASVGFRLVILPGAVVLWPLLAGRWVRGGGRPDEHNAHRDLARRQEAG